MEVMIREKVKIDMEGVTNIYKKDIQETEEAMDVLKKKLREERQEVERKVK